MTKVRVIELICLRHNPIPLLLRSDAYYVGTCIMIIRYTSFVAIQAQPYVTFEANFGSAIVESAAYIPVIKIFENFFLITSNLGR